MIHRRSRPARCTPTLPRDPVASTTIEGSFESETSARMNEVLLPEFDRSKTIDKQGAFVFDGPTNYDLILDFLRKAGIKLDFEGDAVEWMGSKMPMKPTITTPRRMERSRDGRSNSISPPSKAKTMSWLLVMGTQ